MDENDEQLDEDDLKLIELYKKEYELTFPTNNALILLKFMKRWELFLFFNGYLNFTTNNIHQIATELYDKLNTN